mmetsp:Transcript_8559/g.24625  ORF Transcript_8559/g.24625 Transcript_8559/m.24625 type:complete len:231 (-) Transcript_8559:74-766(-)
MASSLHSRRSLEPLLVLPSSPRVQCSSSISSILALSLSLPLCFFSIWIMYLTVRMQRRLMSTYSCGDIHVACFSRGWMSFRCGMRRFLTVRWNRSDFFVLGAEVVAGLDRRADFSGCFVWCDGWNRCFCTGLAVPLGSFALVLLLVVLRVRLRRCPVRPQLAAALVLLAVDDGVVDVADDVCMVLACSGGGCGCDCGCRKVSGRFRCLGLIDQLNDRWIDCWMGSRASKQ